MQWSLSFISYLFYAVLVFCEDSDTSDVKRFPVYRLSFIFLVLVFEFQKPIIVSNLALSSSPLKDASPHSVAIGRLGSVTDTSR